MSHHPAIAGFRIIREIGRGGMGVVYEAVEEVLSRRVALKVLPASALPHPIQIQRFEREAKAAARLHHTNIVPVFGVGEQDGQHYYIMQYIDGLGLDAVLRELRAVRETAQASRSPREVGTHDDIDRRQKHAAPPDDTAEPHVAAADVARSLVSGAFAGTTVLGAAAPTAEGESGPTAVLPPWRVSTHVAAASSTSPALSDTSEMFSHSELNRPYFQSLARIGLQAAEALEYANRQGVLHRDVKPSNLLLDTQGNVWLTDFGLAKTAESDDLTTTGDIVGTLRYMAPERFQGNCDARSDLYGLGLTMYEMVALRPAFIEADRFKLIERIRHGEPTPLKMVTPKVPRDLATIIHKAVEREPSRRYATAAALAEDLRRFLEGRPILARQTSRPERLARWVRRNPWVAAFVVALTFGLLGSALQAIRATRAERAARLAEEATRTERDRAEAEATKAKHSESEARAVLDFFQNKIMAAARPAGQEGGLGKDVTLRAAIDAAERGIGQSFGDQPVAEASIRDTLGESYYYQGATAAAIQQYDRALALRRKVLGLNHAETIASMNNLGTAYVETGRRAEAIALLEDALMRCRANIASDDPLVLVSMGNLAHAYTEAGRFADALPIHEEVLKRLEAQLGPDHIHTLTELNNLATAYRSAGRLAEAIPNYERALERLRKKFGTSHPNTLMAMSNLALAYRDAGRIADAIALEEEALKSSEAQLGPEHPNTLFSMDSLALLYRKAGRLDDALRLTQEALKRRRDKLGPEHLSTLESVNDLARIYVDSSPAKAEPILRQAVATRARTAPDDWTTFDTRSLLGASLAGQKKYAEAEPLLLEGYKGLKARAASVPAKLQGRISEAFDRIVRLYDDWGKKDEADAWRKNRAHQAPAGPHKT
jgi:tetratricopeptide (TPR) repeat protein